MLIIHERTQPLIAKVKSALITREIEKTNQSIFQKYRVRQSLEILERADEVFSEKLAVAFSGGKDSLVALHFALQVNPDIPVIFNNTTVEFPETVSFVHSLAKEWGFDLHVTQPDVPFFGATKERGWATHDERWCCRPYKDEPAFRFLSENKITAEITGTTRTESIYRRSLTPIKMPKKNPGIIRVNPIYDWNEWEIWTYIREQKLPYNPLYDKGYRRVGCWCCPLNGWTHYRRLMKTHPKLFACIEKFEPAHPKIVECKENLSA
jgi:phosphoadenosine phosphosulfate reductase